MIDVGVVMDDVGESNGTDVAAGRDGDDRTRRDRRAGSVGVVVDASDARYVAVAAAGRDGDDR